MDDHDDTFSFALVSSPSVQSSDEAWEADGDQDTDEFEFIGFGDDDSDAASVVSSTETASVVSIAQAHHFEHGRQYHGYKRGRYPLPNDNLETGREFTVHTLMQELANRMLCIADLGHSPRLILDIGTGNGTWAVDIADKYPTSQVVGIDLSPNQSGQRVPPNLRMFVEDFEEEGWMHGLEPDFVHLRGVVDFIQNLDTLLSTVHGQMKTGGWIEFQDLGVDILCDDGSVGQDDPIRVFYDLCAEGMKRLGCTGYGRKDIMERLREAGFRNVQVVTKRVPIAAWSSDRRMQTIGILMMYNILDSVDAYAAKPLAALGISEKERLGWMRRVQRALQDDGIHRYVNCRFCFGQKV